MSIQRMHTILIAIAMSNSPLATTTATTIAQAALLDPAMELVELNSKITVAASQKQPLSTSSRTHGTFAAAASTPRVDHHPSASKDPQHPGFLQQPGVIWDTKLRHWLCAICHKRTNNHPDHHHAGNCEQGSKASSNRSYDTGSNSTTSSSRCPAPHL